MLATLHNNNPRRSIFHTNFTATISAVLFFFILLASEKAMMKKRGVEKSAISLGCGKGPKNWKRVVVGFSSGLRARPKSQACKVSHQQTNDLEKDTSQPKGRQERKGEGREDAILHCGQILVAKYLPLTPKIIPIFSKKKLDAKDQTDLQ
jgi:hypothetical protein